MPLEGKKLDELLSGLLDGELSDGELKLVQLELGDRESVRERLVALRGISQDLKQLNEVSRIRSSTQLGSDFAARVISEAQRQAVQQRLPDDHHVRLADCAERTERGETAKSLRPGSPQHVMHAWSSPRRVAGVVATLAATILLAVWLPTYFDANTGFDADANSLVDAGSLSDPGIPTNPDKVESEELLAAGTNEIAAPEQVLSTPRYVSDIDFKTHIVLVVDVEVTRTALAQDAIGRVLRTHGIVRDRPIVADPRVTEAISESRMTVKPESEDDASDAVIYFIRSDTSQVGAALDEIYVNASDFPHVAFDLAIDSPAARLMETIARSTGTRFALNKSFAAPIAVSAESLDGSPFSGVRKPTRLVSTAQRKQGFGSNPLMGSSTGKLSTVLLIVRAPFAAR